MSPTRPGHGGALPRARAGPVGLVRQAVVPYLSTAQGRKPADSGLTLPTSRRAVPVVKGLFFNAVVEPWALGPPLKQAMQRLKTYLVEDSPVIRDSLVATLQDLTPVEIVGYAEDEFTATRWLSQADNDAGLVIIDIFLKTGSGLGVLHDSALWPQRRKMVVLSNYATADMRLRCLALGADRLFDKSTEIDALIAYCEHLADGADSRPDGLAG